MQNTLVPGKEQKSKEPMSGAKHFWLSFLAVITGVPISIMIVSGILFVIGIFFAIFLAAAAGSATSSSSLPLQYISGNENARHALVSVPIRGVILSGSAADPLQSLFGQSFTDGEKVKEQLRELADNGMADGIILEIDSPGGMVTASKAIADGIEYYKQKTNRPVFAHINGMGASGAYWAASTTDEIYAEQGSEAGSIGVIMGPLVTLNGVMSYGDVSTNQPIGFKYYTAGRSKDLGSPYRPVTPEEDAFLNQQIQAEYEKFVTHVSKERGLSVEKIKGEIGALAYGTDDAVRLGLIDGVKSKEDAYDALAKKADVYGDYKLMRVETPAGLFGSLFGAQGLVQRMRMSEADRSAGRTRFCATNLMDRPLVFTGDINSVCK